MNRYRNLRAISRPTAVFPDATGPSMAPPPGTDTVRILPRDIAEVIVEEGEDIGKPVHLKFGPLASFTSRDRTDLGLLVRKNDLLHGPLLDAVAVHVDGIKDPF